MLEFADLENSVGGLFFFDDVEECGYWLTENEGDTDEIGASPGWHVEICTYRPIIDKSYLHAPDQDETLESLGREIQWEFETDSTELYRDFAELLEGWGEILAPLSYVNAEDVEFI